MTKLGDILQSWRGDNAVRRGIKAADDWSNEQLQYLLGPQGYEALSGATALAREMTPAADFRDYVDYGGRAVESAREGDAAGALGNAGWAGLATLGAVLPGSAAMVDEALTPSRAKAQEVLDLLKSGRADEVTDDMLGALDAEGNRWLFDNYDLPMDEASRMARADGMGFDVPAPDTSGSGRAGASPTASSFSSAFQSTPGGDPRTFHATSRDVKAFDDSFLGSNTADNATDYEDGSFAKNLATLGHWSSDRPLAGKLYAGVDMPLSVRGEFSVADSLDELSDRINHAGGVDAARSNFDGVRVDDEEFGGISTVVFDPANIRSRFARFDPRLKHLSNLLAGGAGLTLGDYLLQRELEGREQ